MIAMAKKTKGREHQTTPPPLLGLETMGEVGYPHQLGEALIMKEKFLKINKKVFQIVNKGNNCTFVLFSS